MDRLHAALALIQDIPTFEMEIVDGRFCFTLGDQPWGQPDSITTVYHYANIDELPGKLEYAYRGYNRWRMRQAQQAAAQPGA
jgi:hypothetical protein